VLGREGGASGRGFGLRDGLMVLMLKVGLIWKFTALLQVVALNVALWRELAGWVRPPRGAPRLFNRRAARSSPSRPLRSIVGNPFASASSLFIHGLISACEMPERRIRYNFDRKPIARFLLPLPLALPTQFLSPSRGTVSSDIPSPQHPPVCNDENALASSTHPVSSCTYHRIWSDPDAGEAESTRMDIRAANTPTSPTLPPPLKPPHSIPSPHPPSTSPTPSSQPVGQPARQSLPLPAMTTNLAHPRCAGAGKSCLSLPPLLSLPPPAAGLPIAAAWVLQPVSSAGRGWRNREREREGDQISPPRATALHR
jgi:hypothetical protein